MKARLKAAAGERGQRAERRAAGADEPPAKRAKKAPAAKPSPKARGVKREAPSSPPRTEELSAYERKRDAQKAQNEAKLRELGLA